MTVLVLAAPTLAEASAEVARLGLAFDVATREDCGVLIVRSSCGGLVTTYATRQVAARKTVERTTAEWMAEGWE